MLYWTQDSTHDSTTVPGPRFFALGATKNKQWWSKSHVGWKWLKRDLSLGVTNLWTRVEMVPRICLKRLSRRGMLTLLEFVHSCRRGWIEGDNSVTDEGRTIRAIFTLQLWRHYENRSWKMSKLCGFRWIAQKPYHHQIWKVNPSVVSLVRTPFKPDWSFGHWGKSVLMALRMDRISFERNWMHVTSTMEQGWVFFIKAVWTCWHTIASIYIYHHIHFLTYIHIYICIHV